MLTRGERLAKRTAAEAEVDNGYPYRLTFMPITVLNLLDDLDAKDAEIAQFGTLKVCHKALSEIFAVLIDERFVGIQWCRTGELEIRIRRGDRYFTNNQEPTVIMALEWAQRMFAQWDAEEVTP